MVNGAKILPETADNEKHLQTLHTFLDRLYGVCSFAVSNRNNMREIVISDESLNSYGFRVLSDGIDIEQYQKNPIMLFMHNRPESPYKDVQLPIGRMENLRREADKWIATPVFDMEDEFAAKIADKYERGFLNMASIGIDIVETSQDEQFLLVGQARPTVTKCKLREVSIVDIGSNDNALAIPEGIELKAGAFVELMATKLSTVVINKPTENMKQTLNPERICALLSLGLDATQEEIEQSIELLNRKAAEREELLKEAEVARQQEVATLINDAINAGTLSKDKVQTFTDIAEKAGIATLKEALACLKKPVKPTDLINNTGTTDALPDWDELDRQPGALLSLKRNQPEVYQQIYAKKFGK